MRILPALFSRTRARVGARTESPTMMSSMKSAARQALHALALLFLLFAIGAPAQAANNAAFVSQSVPATMAPGATYTATVVMANTGTTTWTPSALHGLGAQNPQDNATWSNGRVVLSGPVAPGQNATFVFQLTAPATVGTYNFQWKMVQDFVEWFGAQTPNVAVVVSVPPPRNDAQLIGVSVPSGITQGQSYTVAVTMKNVGTTTWTAGGNYNLGSANPQDNNIWGVQRSPVNGSVAPGQQITFSLPVVAPAAGSYTMSWAMVQDFVGWFGPASATVVTVNPPVAPVPTMSVSRNPSPMTAGQGFTLSWSSTNATSISRVCTTNGTGYTVNDAPALNGSSSGTASSAWVNNASNCVWRATGAGGTAIFTETMTTNAAPTPAPTMSASRNPSPMTAGQAFTLTWTSANATSVSRVCTAGGSGYTVNDAPAINGSLGGTASAGWVNNPSSCVWRATGAGGTVTFNETMTTNAATSVETVTYIHTDGLGSPVARSNAAGQLVGNKTRYEPYGLTAAGDTPTIGFTGHVNDADTGLVYMQQRYYDPVAGRFLSIDPVTTDANTGGSFNRYSYANNSPYKYIDPDGRDSDNACGQCNRGGQNGLANLVETVSDIVHSDIFAKLSEPLMVAEFGALKAVGGTVRALEGGARAEKAAVLAGNAATGKAGEAATRAALGEAKAGEQVTFVTSTGERTRADFVTTTQGVVETKTGGATLTGGQKQLQADVGAGTAVTPVGKNAAAAGLQPGKPVVLNDFKIDKQ